VQSNPFLADLADRFKLSVEDLPPESFLLRTITDDNRHYLCIAGRDERGVLYGAQETFGQVITGTPHGELYVPECELRRNPAVAVLGTHSLTCWGLAPRYDREAWERTIDSISAADHNRIMFWIHGLFRSRLFPYVFLDSSYFTGAKLTDDDIRQLIRHAHDRGMVFLFGSGVFGWFTFNTAPRRRASRRSLTYFGEVSLIVKLRRCFTGYCW
jgi:hypothetical protein